MKKHVLLAKMLMIVAFTGFLTAFSSQSYAQCDLTFNISGNSGAVLDIDQNQNNTCMATFSQTDLAQQFTAVSSSSCGAGLTFDGGATGDLTIELYDALPNAGGVLLATGTTTLTGQTEGDVTWPSVGLTIGVQYYLVFTSPNITTCVAGSTTNPYAGGILYANAGFQPFANFDYTFRHFTCGAGGWGDATTWTVTDNDGNVVLSGGPYGNGYSDSQTIVGANNGPYTYTIVSAFSDNSPDYSVVSGVNVLFSGNVPGLSTVNVGPINCPTGPPPPSCDITFDISSASWGDATTWTVTDNDGNTVLSGGPYGNGYADVQTLTGANNGPYIWNIVSTLGDNSPNYTVSSGADVLFTGNVPGGATANVGPINCPAPAACDITVNMSSASWGDGTTWTLTDNDGNTVLSGGPYGNGYADSQTLTGASNAPYTLNITTTFSDNSPNYEVLIDGGLEWSGNIPGGQTGTVSNITCAGNVPPPPAGCDLTFDISSASWGDGTTWTLTDNDGNTVLSGGPYGNGYADSQTLTGADNAPYTLTIVSTLFDNSPNYEVSSGADVLFTGNVPGATTANVGPINCPVPPPPAGCDLTFDISSASWGDATTWTVTDNDGNTVLSGGPYGNGYADVQTLTGANNGPYTWNIVSTLGDNSPNYTVSSGVDVLFTGNVPGNSTANVGPINCPAPPSCEISVTMSSASWGDATTWTLTDNDGNTVLSGGPYGNGYSDTQTLPVADNGPYTLTITSNLSDNIPNYSVSVDGSVILSGTAPASQTTVLNNISCNYVPPCQIDVDMSSASWGDGTTWALTDADGNTVLSGGPYGNGYSDSQTLAGASDGPYTLTINSTLFDNFPEYSVSVGGNVVFSGTAPAAQTTTVGPIAPECSIPPTPCEGALPIACGDVVTGSTIGAPNDAVDFCGTTNGTGGKIWYEFTGTGDVVTATTCSALTSYDTKLWVFSGDCNNLVCVTGNDDDFTCGFSGLQSNVEFVSTLGETYYIIVGGFGAGAGNYELTVTCAPVPVIPDCATNINVAIPSCGTGDISITWDAVPEANNYNIYAGTAPGLNDIANPFPLGNFTEVLLQNPLLNTTYYVTVVPSNLAGEAVGCIEFSFTSPDACPPPANDDICDAADVTNMVVQDLNTYAFLSDMTCDNNIGNNENGTPSAVGPSCGAANGNDTWYSFTTPNCSVGGSVPFTIELTTNNPGTNYDTKIALFISDDNTCTGNMTQVVCNDDNGFGGNPAMCGANPSGMVSAIVIDALLPNTNYWVYVGGFNGATGTYELSGRALTPAHGVSAVGGGTQIQLTTTDMGAALYTYYYKLIGSTGYSTANSQTALTNVRTLAPGNDYITQVMYRCDANFFNQNQWYRTEPQTITLESTCAIVNDMTCTFNGPNSYTLTWTEPTGDLFTNNGALSGYRIKRNPVGSSGVYTFSNPAVVCSGGTCSVTLPGNSPTGFNWTIETRCSANNIQVGNTTSCGPAPEMPNNPDNNNNTDRISANVFSFVNAEAGIEFVDVQMFDAYADFGLNTPMIGDYEIFVNDNNEINWRRVDAPAMSFDFIIVPNPTNAMSTVYLSTIVEEGVYTVIDAMGRTINAGSINNTDNIDLDATQLQSGVYMVVVTVGNQQLTRRLIVAN